LTQISTFLFDSSKLVPRFATESAVFLALGKASAKDTPKKILSKKFGEDFLTIKKYRVLCFNQ
jgi:hypothetical protein